MKTRIIAVAVLLLIMISCTKTPEQMLVGNWQGEEGTMEFFKDGSMIMTFMKAPAPGVNSVKGSWAAPEEGKIAITISVFGETNTKSGSFNFSDDDTLNLVDDNNGVVDSFTRIASSGDSGKAKASSSSSVVGLYGGKGCVYDRMELKEDGKIYVTAFGMEFPGTYEVDGDRVSFTDGQGQGIVFRKKGDALDGGIAGVCNRM